MKNLLITTALCFAATSASAELTYGSAFAKVHNFDGNGGSNDLATYNGAIEYRYDNLIFSGEVGKIDSDGGDFDFADFGLGYTLQNGVTIGLDYSGFDLEGEDADIVSAYAMYSFGAYTLGLSAGDSSDLEDTAYSIFGAWDVSSDGTVGADIIRLDGETLIAAYATYDLDRYSLDADVFSSDGLDVFALSGGYDLGNNFAVIGSLSIADLDGDDLKALSVGAQYEFAPGANVELAVGRIDVDGGDNVDRLSLGVNYEFGKRTSKRRALGGILVDASASSLGLTDF